MKPHSVTLMSIGEPMSPRMLPSRTPASIDATSVACSRSPPSAQACSDGEPSVGSGDLQLAARQRIEKHGKFLRKRHVGAAHRADLFEPGAMTFGRFDEARMQHAHGAFGEAEHEIGAVLEVHIEECARQARAARDVVHGQCVETDLAAGGFGGVDDFRAAALLFFESAFGDVAHGRGA